MRSIPFIAAAAILLALAAPGAAAQETAAHFEKRAATAKALVEAFQRTVIEKKLGPDAQENAQFVSRQIGDAQALLTGGNTKEALALLDQAYQTIRHLVADARQGEKAESGGGESAAQLTAANARRAKELFEGRKRAFGSLRDAYDRVAKEKGIGDRDAEDLAEIDASVFAADALAKKAAFEEASIALDAPYRLVRAMLIRLRQGDKLVRELKFDSPEDEYRYEKDRIVSYALLLQLTMDEEPIAPERLKKVEDLKNQAMAMKNQAEAKAKSGDFSDASAALERASKIYIRALQTAGRMIPG